MPRVRKVAARSERLLLGSMLLVLAVAVAAVMLVGSGPEDQRLAERHPEAQMVEAVRSQLARFPQDGRSLGEPTAPVTMSLYADLQCLPCRKLMIGPLGRIIAEQVQHGMLRIDFFSLRSASDDPQVFVAQQAAALAAGEQDRLWQFVALFFRQQGNEDGGYVTPAFLRRLARQTGIDVARWERDRRSPRILRRVAAARARARRLGIDAAPTLVLVGPRGTHTVVGNPGFAGLEAAYDRVWH